MKKLFYFIVFSLLLRTMSVVFVFAVRGFVTGSFQAAYVYTPEVCISPMFGFLCDDRHPVLVLPSGKNRRKGNL